LSPTNFLAYQILPISDSNKNEYIYARWKQAYIHPRRGIYQMQGGICYSKICILLSLWNIYFILEEVYTRCREVYAVQKYEVYAL
jgi:hypothetical protein